MRQVFSSPRLENVEAVADMLRAQDIEVRITNGRGYRSAIRGNFSYRDQAGGTPRPAVWVVRSEQQPQARQLLREAGLLQAGPSTDDSFLPPEIRQRNADATADAARKRSRMRYGLLALIAVMASLVLVTTRRNTTRTPDPATPAVASADTPRSPLIAGADTFVIPTPPALAETLFRRVATGQRTGPLCLAIDGNDPGPDLLARMAASRRAVQVASACATEADATWVDARQYRTDGSGSGTVELLVLTRQGGRTIDTDRLRLTVARDGVHWHVLDER
ncbi:hypothetical protein [Luteimonas vadosa]|uniref:DUF2007 domain-containing protein n=1 Tax=Luteimonas vadosa TaxID=1165507 RepID=A0ABP9DW44_9GAMM